MSVSVVLPTYEERDSILPLVEGILAVLPGAEVIVVDDASPDGTAEVVEAARARHPGLVLVRRERDPGLRASLAEGAQRATGDVVVFMDADGSHPPEVLPRLLAALGEGDVAADLAIASRFAPGGSDGRGAAAASLASRVLNGLARTLLDRRVTDWTGGFAAIRAYRLRQFGLSGDYGEYFIDLAFQVLRSGARVVELPFAYVPRTQGYSKTASNPFGLLRRGLPYLRMILRLAILDRTIPAARRRGG